VTSRSHELFRAAQERTPGGVNSPVRAFRGVGGEPFFVERAKGSRIWTVDGVELIDYVGSWGPAILGHASPIVVSAVCEAAQRGVSFGIPNPLEVEMAELICAWMPAIEKVRLVNSGTEATMSCLRLARGFTKRDKIVKFAGCYHGHADSLLVKAGSGALTHGQPDSAGVPRAVAGETIVLPFNNIEAVRAAFRENKDQIASVILEPIPANAGLFLPREDFLHQLQEECAKNGALLIFDEVMTGFRLARGGAQQLHGIRPDLTALGKVIGGGLPVGAFGGRAEIMDQLSPDGPVYQAGTLSGNPLALAAGLAQLRELDRIDGWRLLEDLGAKLESRLADAISEKELTLHRIGSMFCLFFASGPIFDLESAQRSDTKKFAQFFHSCFERGIYFPPSQFETAFLSTAHTALEIEETIEVIRRVIGAS
jgi:glutamate-1-semialdehyde 2,1-aminomutase